MKQMLGMPEAIISGYECIFGATVKMGDKLKTCQVLKSISAVKKTRLGIGRFWVIDVVTTNQDGEYVGTDTYTCLGYRRPAK